MAIDRQSLSPDRDPQRRSGRGDPPGVAPHPARDRRRGARRSRPRPAGGRRRDGRSVQPERAARRQADRGARLPRAVGVHPPRPEPGSNRRLRRTEPRLRCGRRPGLRDRPRPRPPSGQLRRLPGLRPGHRLARHRPAGGGRSARAERPARPDPTSRHVPLAGRAARQDLAEPRGGSRPRRRCDRGPLPDPRDRPGRPGRGAERDDDHQLELAVALRWTHVRRTDRDGAPRPAGRRHAVHAGRGDDAGLAGRGARPAERRGPVHGRAGPDRPTRAHR